MSLSKQYLIPALGLLSMILGYSSSWAVPPGALQPHPVVKKKAVKLFGKIDEVNSALGAAGITLDSDGLPATIGDVRIGSPAFYAGLAENDKILQGKITESKLFIIFLRNDKRYSVTLNTAPVNLANPEPDKKRLQAITKKIARHRLEDYDIFVVLDTSSSMFSPLNSVNETKWQWCANCVQTFAEKLRSVSEQELTVVPFSDKFTIERHCKPKRIADLLRTTKPVGGTDMQAPLAAIFKEFLATSQLRPILIVILTDGVPNSEQAVIKEIKDATQQMIAPDRIQITFLEIGEELHAQAFLKYLDTLLKADGAKYDIVHSYTFAELKEAGLSETLLRSITAKRETLDSENSLQKQLQTVKEQMQIEQELRRSAIPTPAPDKERLKQGKNL